MEIEVEAVKLISDYFLSCLGKLYKCKFFKWKGRKRIHSTKPESSFRPRRWDVEMSSGSWNNFYKVSDMKFMRFRGVRVGRWMHYVYAAMNYCFSSASLSKAIWEKCKKVVKFWTICVCWLIKKQTKLRWTYSETKEERKTNLLRVHIIACTHSFAYLFQSFVKDFRYLTICFFSRAGVERVFKVSSFFESNEDINECLLSLQLNWVFFFLRKL